MKTEAKAPGPTAAQEYLKPVGVDERLMFNCDGALGDMCFHMDGKRVHDSDSLSGTSDSDADEQLIDEDGYSDTSADYSPGGKRATLEELYGDGLYQVRRPFAV